jgi:4-amino-4-deoxy-L-arabinose transferase-like glycosyltransferase
MKSDFLAGKWWTPRLVWPLVMATVVRLALLATALIRIGTSALFCADTYGYIVPGRNLLHGSFRNAHGLPELLRTPGYPLFLALTSLDGPAVAALLQVILSVFTVLLVWRLARTVFDDARIALVAAWIFAFEPISVSYSIVLLSETLFLALFLLCLIGLAEFLRARRLQALAVAGLWLAAATFVRPVTYYLPVALAVGLFAVLARVPRLRWKAPAVLLLSVLPWLAAWQLHNWIETGFGGFESVEALNIYTYQAAGVIARVEHRSFEDVQNEFNRLAAQPGWNQVQRAAFMHSEGVRILCAHPGITLRSQLEGSARVAFNPGAAGLLELLDVPIDNSMLVRAHGTGPIRAGLLIVQAYPQQAVVMAAAEVFLLGLYLFAAWGAMRGQADRSCLWLLLGVFLYFVAVSGGEQAVVRFRLPVMPILCIFAAAGMLVQRPGATTKTA